MEFYNLLETLGLFLRFIISIFLYLYLESNIGAFFYKRKIEKLGGNFADEAKKDLQNRINSHKP